MARFEMGNETMSAYLAARSHLFGSRFARSLLFYGAAWLIGAVLLSALHLAFSTNQGISGRSSASPALQSLPAEQPGRSAGVAGDL